MKKKQLTEGTAAKPRQKSDTGPDNVNSKSVARLAGVSQATVSRVFNSHENVRPETRLRILEAAHTLGYRPNAIARSLTSKKSDLIAVVAIDAVNPHFHSIINKVSRKIQQSGRQTLFFTSPKEQELDAVLAQILQYQVDAIIVLSAVLSTQMTKECARVQVPVVVFNKYTINDSVLSVCSDNVGAGWIAANYLYEKGHRRFAFIGSDTFYGTSIDRQKGFLDCLTEKGIPDCVLRSIPYSYCDGQAAMRSILRENERPDAVFCAGDLMAFGAMDVARFEFHLKIPDDIAILGFDDIQDSSFEAYRLTTIAQQIDAMLSNAFDYLEKCLSGQPVSNGVQLFECRIVERDSA